VIDHLHARYMRQGASRRPMQYIGEADVAERL
jgi:hypothetical protein